MASHTKNGRQDALKRMLDTMLQGESDYAQPIAALLQGNPEKYLPIFKQEEKKIERIQS